MIVLLDRLVRLLPCGRFIYTPSGLSAWIGNDGQWYGETRSPRLALLFLIRGDIMGCGDVAVPAPRRNDPARDVQLDDLSLP
jgi:hypothetical protein